MSLTQHLRDRQSPVRAWFEARLPHTRQAVTEANRFLRDGRITCPVKAPAGSDSAVVGTAVDYLVRAHLSHTALDTTAASKAGWSSKELAHKAMLVEQAAVEDVKALRPWQHELDQGGWAALCAACALLAKFEQCFRAGRVVSWHVERALSTLGEADDVAALVSFTVGEATLVDLGALGKAAVADHLDLRDAGVLHLNPTFAQSRALGGADADLVYDGTLLDFKATGGAQVVARRVLWQLLGYALADTADAYTIEAVGISALRWRRRIIWSLDGLLEELSNASTPAVVASLRGEFSRVLGQPELS